MIRQYPQSYPALPRPDIDWPVVFGSIALAAAILWLSAFISNPTPSSYTAPSNELTLSGALAGNVALECRNQSWHSQDIPLTLSVSPGLANGYYSLTGSQVLASLTLTDASGNALRTFSVQEGSLDVRPDGMYLSAMLHDELGAILYASGRLSC